MKSGWHTQGFTVVEVMIFLAVSSILLVSALLLIGGQQQRTEFSQAINDINQQIQDIMNNVAIGYYSRPSDFTCTAPGGMPTISPGPQAEGTSQDCIFIGRVMQFGLSGSNGEKFNVYNIIGARETLISGQPQITTTLSQAHPTVLASSIEQDILEYGLNVAKMYYDGNPGNTISAVGFFSTLGQTASGGGLVSGSQTVELRPVTSSASVGTANVNSGKLQSEINTQDGANLAIVPDGGVTICFNSGGTKQYATITIGGNGRQTATTLSIQDGTC